MATTEVKPEGNGFQVKQRFSKFCNLPELMQSVHQFADVITNADLSLDVPDVDVVPVPVPISPAQRECVQELVARADAIRAGGVAPEDDNMLNVTTDGRKIAIDPKLLLDHAGDPHSWTPADMQAVLRTLLGRIDGILNPGQEPRPVELRGLNWIVSPYQGQVVVAFEIASASAVAGPFDAPADVLESLLNQAVAPEHGAPGYRVH